MGPASPAPCRSSKLGRIENRLWWIRLRGRARVLDHGVEREHALALLQEKYPQYLTEVLEWDGST
jgi:hypothetical protein